MKKIFILTAIGAATMLSADYYDQNDQAYDQSYDQQYYQSNNGNNNQENNDQAQNQKNTKAVPNTVLAERIHNALSGGWFSKGYQNVSYEIYRGNVILKGTVSTLHEREKVAETVKGVEGVRNVDNQLRVAYNMKTPEQVQQETNQESKYKQDFAATYTDKLINDKIREKLSGGWFSKSNETLAFRTSNGYVMVSGIVQKPEEAKKIVEQLQDIDGVRGIRDQLQVRNDTTK